MHYNGERESTTWTQHHTPQRLRAHYAIATAQCECEWLRLCPSSVVVNHSLPRWMTRRWYMKNTRNTGEKILNNNVCPSYKFWTKILYELNIGNYIPAYFHLCKYEKLWQNLIFYDDARSPCISLSLSRPWHHKQTFTVTARRSQGHHLAVSSRQSIRCKFLISIVSLFCQLIILHFLFTPANR